MVTSERNGCKMPVQAKEVWYSYRDGYQETFENKVLKLYTKPGAAQTLLKNLKEATKMSDVTEAHLLTCPHNPLINYTAPIISLPNGRAIVYFDCLGELELAEQIALQQSPEVASKIGDDPEHTAIMYFGSGSTYGQCLGKALGLKIGIVAWGEIKPKWRENVISSIPFSSIIDLPHNKMQKRLSLGWPQLAKFAKYDINRLLIADDVAATGESLFAAEDLVAKVAGKLNHPIEILGYIVAAREGNDSNPRMESRLLAAPVFKIPVL
jgi:hypothetical protein